MLIWLLSARRPEDPTPLSNKRKRQSSFTGINRLNTSNANPTLPPRTPSSAKKTSTADSDAAPPAPVRNERTFLLPFFSCAIDST